MSKQSHRLRAKRQHKWNRDIPDSILLLKGRRFDQLPSAQSLHPDQRVMDRFIAGDISAGAVIEAWRPSFIVTVVRR